MVNLNIVIVVALVAVVGFGAATLTVPLNIEVSAQGNTTGNQTGNWTDSSMSESEP